MTRPSRTTVITLSVAIFLAAAAITITIGISGAVDPLGDDAPTTAATPTATPTTQVHDINGQAACEALADGPVLEVATEADRWDEDDARDWLNDLSRIGYMAEAAEDADLARVGGHIVDTLSEGGQIKQLWPQMIDATVELIVACDDSGLAGEQLSDRAMELTGRG